MDLLGYFLRATPGFKGRGRLTNFWIERPREKDHRMQQLPGGARVRCDMSIPYESMVWLGREEENDLAALRRILQPGETFVDCGANVGIWTLAAATAVGGLGKIYAFEPNPATFEKLSHHIRLNRLEERVQALAVACGAHEDQMPLACGDDHNNSRLVSVDGDAPMAVMVPVTTLDKQLGGTPVHGIKIDVEGYEMEVLKGAQNILRESRPWLCVEFNTLLSGANRLGDWDVHQFLRALGYSCRPMADAAGMRAENALRDDWVASGYCNLFYFIHE